MFQSQIARLDFGFHSKGRSNFDSDLSSQDIIEPMGLLPLLKLGDYLVHRLTDRFGKAFDRDSCRDGHHIGGRLAHPRVW